MSNARVSISKSYGKHIAVHVEVTADANSRIDRDPSIEAIEQFEELDKKFNLKKENE